MNATLLLISGANIVKNFIEREKLLIIISEQNYLTRIIHVNSGNSSIR